MSKIQSEPSVFCKFGEVIQLTTEMVEIVEMFLKLDNPYLKQVEPWKKLEQLTTKSNAPKGFAKRVFITQKTENVLPTLTEYPKSIGNKK